MTLAAVPRRVEEDPMADVEEAVAAIARGGMAIVVDDPERENEGDLVAAAELVTPETINFMATHGRGLICCPVPAEQLDRLHIPPMSNGAGDRFGTAFHVGVDHRDAGTGISAADRALVIRALADPDSQPADFRQPGHVFPLAYQPHGVLQRRGHTEASVDLARLAGLSPAAVICEIASDDGEMARLPALFDLAARHDIPVISIADLVTYRRTHEQWLDRVTETRLPLAAGQFRAIGYRDRVDGGEHLALVHGDLADVANPLVRIHSECVTGDALGSLRCDCRQRLHLALDRIGQEPAGVVVYLRGHQGRGIGLAKPVDQRDHGIGAQILRDLGVLAPRVLSDNPGQYQALFTYGLAPVEQVPLVPSGSGSSVVERLGHLAG
jgi:3,4-dihydroxy 2-butanone 4-phosphate synthase / GTP cyclohydrolase II